MDSGIYFLRKLVHTIVFVAVVAMFEQFVWEPMAYHQDKIVTNQAIVLVTKADINSSGEVSDILVGYEYRPSRFNADNYLKKLSEHAYRRKPTSDYSEALTLHNVYTNEYIGNEPVKYDGVFRFNITVDGFHVYKASYEISIPRTEKSPTFFLVESLDDAKRILGLSNVTKLGDFTFEDMGAVRSD